MKNRPSPSQTLFQVLRAGTRHHKEQNKAIVRVVKAARDSGKNHLEKGKNQLINISESLVFVVFLDIYK